MPSRGTSNGGERARRERGSDSPVARTIPGGEPAERTFPTEPRTGAHPTSPDLDDLANLIGRTVELDAGRTARVTAALVAGIDRPILLRVEVAPFGGIAYLPVAALESSVGAIRAGGVHLLMRGTEIGFYENQGLEWVGSHESIVEDVSTVDARGNVRF